jgi:hypothetical protein
MFKHIITKAALVLPVAALAVFGVASAASAGTNSGGSGAVNPSNQYDAGVTATWSVTDVANGGWYKIENATITTTGGYGWHQTYTLTEKQKTQSGPVTVTGTAYLWTEYGSYTEAITPLTLPSFDIPFANTTGGVSTENSTPVGQDLLNTDIDIVYNVHPAGVNADYWFGY